MASRKTNKTGRTWRMRAEMLEIDIVSRYRGHPTIFSILLHHGGEFTNFPGRKYIGGKKTFVDLLDRDRFCIYDIHEMMDELGYVSEGNLLYYHFKSPVGDLDFGLIALGSVEDALYLGTFVSQHKLIEVYIEHGKTNLHTDVCHPITNDMTDMEGSNGDVGDLIPNDNVAEFGDLGSDGGDSNGDEGGPILTDDDGSDIQDSEFLLDEDNIIDDEDVDMREFELNIDRDVEWVGGSSKTVVDEGVNEDDIEVINNEVLLSGSSSDEEMGGKRKKSIRAIRRAHENDEALVSDPFYVLQTFGSAKEFKDKVRLHAIETRRELELEKNDKNRVRWLCKGTLPNLGVDQQEEEQCSWVLYASKWKKDANWTVKTYNKEHKCLQTRTVKACTYRFLSSQIVDQVESNPTIPNRALQEQLQRTYKVDISLMKAFRAKADAKNLVQGDYATQYSLLRDYILELQTRNPDTTVKVDVESETDLGSETRTFRRIYICLGALKQGFAAGKRDFLGLDGAFMKGPYPGQILTAVGLDGNNGTYPLAFAVVETENTSSWTWFLTCLGEDIGLHSRSNFTFISDRQKGILQAITSLFPCAENRYCVRHICENMKKRWRGKPFEVALWKCANATHVQEFNQCMEEVKKLNNDCYEYLKKIPAQHWSKSHFTGRAHTDIILNNLCETLNGKLVKGRDKPIITCLDFIREYIMKKIVNVEKAIGKAAGPLTPTAMRTLENVKNEAADYISVFCGNGKYQVKGPLMDQCIVDVVQQTCSCRKWEVTGIPCKHAIATIWEMRKNSRSVGLPETWVHQVYWIQTWKDMYSFKVEPINGRRMWEKSQCPTTLIPPRHHVTIGRPKKKRRKSVVEAENMVKGNRASRAYKSVTCSKCKNTGHNVRSCKGQSVGSGDVGTSKGKGKGSGDVGTSKGKGKANGGVGASKGKGKGSGDVGTSKDKGKASGGVGASKGKS